MTRNDEQRGFLFGILWAAWWLQSGHGEDQYAEWLIREVGGVSTIKRMAHKHDYHFKRGFWADLERSVKRDRSDAVAMSAAKSAAAAEPGEPYETS